MDKSIISKLSFENYVVKSIDFKLNMEYDMDKEVELDLNFDNDIQIDMENKTAIIGLTCTVFDDYTEKGYPFFLKLELLSFFRFESDLDEERVKNLIEINGMSITFPYLRAIITNITGNVGIQPLIIPTLNISNYFKHKSKKTEAI